MDNNKDLGEGFRATAGIRQGCPLSPLLFALVADMLLKKLSRTWPDALVTAFADDAAIILENIDDLPRVMKLFREYEAFSGLALNIRMTVVVPLGASNTGEVRNRLRAALPEIDEMVVDKGAKYLGVWVGPEGGDRAWKEVLARYKERLQAWSRISVGVFLDVRMYNVFVFSTGVGLTSSKT